jgi:hypothetical protein
MAHYSETGLLGKRGVFTIPSVERDEGILLRPAIATALEMYDDQRVAEFLLSNAVDAADHETAREEVRALGLDPGAVPHP